MSGPGPKDPLVSLFLPNQTVLEASPSYSCIKVQIMHKFNILRFVQEIIVSLSNYQPLRYHKNFTTDDILLPNIVENLKMVLAHM